MADVEVSYRGQIIRSLSASGTEVLHTEGKYCDDDITIDYTSPGGGGANLQTKSVSYTPDETGISDTILPDPGYDGMDEVDVTVTAIPDTYVGSAIPQRDSTSLTSTGNVVHVPAGYYASAASRGVNNGTAGTPTASKGAVSNHSVDVTPSVTNTTGWITGGTINGTPVSVSASELVSGSQTVTVNDTYDVTNLAELVVAVPSGGATKGSFTPASNSLTYVVSALIDATFDYIQIAYDPWTFPGNNVRTLMFGWVDYVHTFSVSVGTNAAGTATGGTYQVASTTSAGFKIDTTTGTMQSVNGSGGGYFAAGITYNWMVWS